MNNIVEWISHQARSNPSKCALFNSEYQINYYELDMISNMVGAILTSYGVEAKDRVIIQGSSDPFTIAVIIGILKNGSVYCPVDNYTPESRLDFIISQIEPKIIITEQVSNLIACKNNENITISYLKMIWNAKQEKQSFIDNVKVDVSNLNAYCIYTSGSTGTPKGVVITHKNIMNFFEGIKEFYDIDGYSVCASFTSINFDATLIDVFFPLYCGASVFIYDDVKLPDFICDAIVENKISHLSLWGMMLTLPTKSQSFSKAKFESLRTIITGADVPDARSVKEWQVKGEKIKIVNAYGPTEATCAVSAYTLGTSEVEELGIIPIGKALKNASISLRDMNGDIISEPGIQGELYVSGKQLMREYYNLPEETSTKLIHIEGVRHYKTGDLCEYADDYNIKFIGRKDHEVNIGGYRVHLNEIKVVVERHELIDYAEILVDDTKLGEKIIVVFAILNKNYSGDVSCVVQALMDDCRENLPTYMIPREISFVDSFPRLSSGKVNRRMLKETMTTSAQAVY
ncbi:AMP-binding protein [Vibrio mediterranei]|uniref:AMP-binding protein n=1 Tax=Vibrio mediterranei TaxID=689 RepID=UPI001EFECD3D|nr:AMP-binding protein [Vibrio mediterranei]MCG9629024.1 AMP-binding protein [Vibrio mediterranei]